MGKIDFQDGLKKFLTTSEVSIKEGWKQLNENGYKILFVVDGDGVLEGSVTDGDIRRWILADESILEPIAKVMMRDPVMVLESDSIEKMKELMLSQRIECLPVVDKIGRPKRLEFWDHIFQENKDSISGVVDVPVVIMAGGRGVRLDPFTKVLPKPLIPVGDKPIIEVIIERFCAYQVNQFYLSLNYRSNMIKAYFQDTTHDYELNYIDETAPSGTAGSLHMLDGVIKSTFIVSNCDILIDANYADILKYHRDNKNKITMVCSMRHFPIPYGVVEIEGGMLKEIREKPEYDFLVNTGLYILEPELLRLIPKDRVYHITHLIEQLRLENQKIGVYPVAAHSWMDVGELKEYQQTLLRFR